jgi:hypothetical protein
MLSDTYGALASLDHFRRRLMALAPRSYNQQDLEDLIGCPKIVSIS